MGILRRLGVGEARIIAQNNIAAGVVREVRPCYWLKVNRKVVRALAGDGAEVAHIVCFVYDVAGREYKGGDAAAAGRGSVSRWMMTRVRRRSGRCVEVGAVYLIGGFDQVN